MVKRLLYLTLAIIVSVGVLLAWPDTDRGGPPVGTGAAWAVATESYPFQKLWIPPALHGTEFNLTLGKSTASFWPGATTDTYTFNGVSFWGPTLIFKKGDRVHLHVKNDLDEPTTLHWHGLHLPAEADGGPRQIIQPGGTWDPSFTVMNNAATYWYHPHPHQATQDQLTDGAGGLIIIQDPAEEALPLPRTYGVDDIPLVFTSRRFLKNNQFSHKGDHDKYGDYLLANGTLDAKVELPAQYVRLRILNAEIERGYNLGFSDNRTFYLIATDGGLVDKPVPLTRMNLMVGERAELLVNLGSDQPGSHVDLVAYNSGQTFGFPGCERQAGRPNGSYLNDIDFRLLRVQIGKSTPGAITSPPDHLTENHFWTDADVTNRRALHITQGTPGGLPFCFDDEAYNMRSTDHLQVVKLGAVEAWSITNNRVFGHSFHMHDVQFKIASRSLGPVRPYEQGWKDTVFIQRDETVTVIAKFEDYASETTPYMFHCHMANHEDGGLMGEFVVVKDPATFSPNALILNEPHPVTEQMLTQSRALEQHTAPNFETNDISGSKLTLATLTATRPTVLLFMQKDCPCSETAAPQFERLQQELGETCTVVGVIDGTTTEAQKWAKRVGVHFPLVADTDLSIVKSYGVRHSLCTVMIQRGGIIAHVYPGYSASMLSGLAQEIEQPSDRTVAPLSFDGAPTRLTAGCPYGLVLDGNAGQ